MPRPRGCKTGAYGPDRVRGRKTGAYCRAGPSRGRTTRADVPGGVTTRRSQVILGTVTTFVPGYLGARLGTVGAGRAPAHPPIANHWAI
ncbi:MAG: hypothetical protein HY329_13315 [Chloroflexi bacterium]|nr:hypothetical protein [Chloroflexota bacterium]